MRKSTFFLRLALFLFPLVVAALALEWRLAATPTTQSYKRALLDRFTDTVEVLVLGTSNAYFAFDPAQFGRPGLNMAHTSQSLAIDGQILEKFAPGLARLRVVVLNLSYFSLEYRLYGNADDYREFQFTRAFAIEGDGGWLARFDVRRYSRLADYGVDQTRRILTAELGAHLEREIQPTGWFDSDHSSYPHLPITTEAGRDRARYHTSTLRPELTAQNLAWIGRMAELSKRQGFRLILSRAPAFRTYTENLDPAAEARFARDIADLKQTYGLRFYDYLRDGRFSSEDFYDNDHLASAGARKFSRLFDQEVLAPLL